LYGFILFILENYKLKECSGNKNDALQDIIDPRWLLIYRYENHDLHRQPGVRLENTLKTSDKRIEDAEPVKRKIGRPVGAQNKNTSIRSDK
jgi:hypothetical protein